jgi:hypothetical protein
METMVDASMEPAEPEMVSMLAPTRQEAHRPSGASGGTGFPQRGHCRDCCEFSVAIPGIERTARESYTSRPLKSNVSEVFFLYESRSTGVLLAERISV